MKRICYASAAFATALVTASLAPAHAEEVYPTPETCAVIGDSLTAQDGMGVTWVPAALTASGKCNGGIYFYAVGGKKISAPDSKGKTTMVNIKEARTKFGGRVDHWLFALGTNNAGMTADAFTAEVNKIIPLVNADEDFTWVDVAFFNVNNSKVKIVNPALQKAVEATPNGHYAPWNTYIHDPVRNNGDKVTLWKQPFDSTHYNEFGYSIRNQFYADQIGA